MISLWSALEAAGDLPGRYLWDEDKSAGLSDLRSGSAIQNQGASHGGDLRGHSVLVAMTNQLAAALAMIELDGVARRIVLYPPDLPLDYLGFVAASAGVETIVSDRPAAELSISQVRRIVACSGVISSGAVDRTASCSTEWILLTSGTTGKPKLVVHSLQSLGGAIHPGTSATERVVWSTFYNICRYGGLQILLRALLTGTSLVLSNTQESTADFLARAGSRGVTHISGTPSHWRRALMSSAAERIDPKYVRLSGEISDQPILNRLRATYPHAAVAHAFATTEAGVAFAVNDGTAGFPYEALGETPHVEMKIEDGSLRIRSARTASHYLDDPSRPLRDAENYVDTGDLIELREGRCYFAGRRDGVINVGGLKVHPEEVEAVINRHPAVEMSLVQRKKSSISGALVVASVVLKAASEPAIRDIGGVQREILLLCRDTLSPHKVPAAVKIVPSLALAESGKLMRRDA